MNAVTTATTEKEILEVFPVAELPKVTSPPDFNSLYEMLLALRQNAASIATPLAGGRHGHLPILFSAAAWQAIDAANPWQDPVDPGLHPNVVAAWGAAPTQAQIAQTNREHKNNKSIYQTFRNVENALRKQIANAVPETYLRGYHQRYVGLNNRSPREIIDYLFNTYGKLTPTDLAANDNYFREPWDPSEPLESFFYRIEQAVDIASLGNQPFSDAQILNNAYDSVFRTGIYKDECKTWLARPAVEHTWDNFKTHFYEAQVRLNEFQRASGNKNQANYAAEVAHALDKLALATTDDRGAVASLTKTVEQLTTQMEQLQKSLREKDDRIDQLLKNITNATNATNSDNSNKRKRPDDTIWTDEDYCWTHGYRIKKGHNSKNCKSRKEGHQEAATRSNNMNGSQAGKPRN